MGKGLATTYKPSEARYDLGGKVQYLVYQSPQPLANGRVQMRTRVKRLYFPGDARDITVGKPGWYRNRQGSDLPSSLTGYGKPESSCRTVRWPTSRFR